MVRRMNESVARVSDEVWLGGDESRVSSVESRRGGTRMLSLHVMPPPPPSPWHSARSSCLQLRVIHSRA